MRIDPTPFEPAMPQAVRAAIAEARAGRGPLVAWLNNDDGGWGQVSDCFGLLRGHPERLDDLVVGWVVGMGMFGDDLHALPGVIKRERQYGVIPGALAAFAAGLEAGVKAQKRQWKSVETIAGLAKQVPESFCSALPLGLASDSALARGAALRLAQKIGEPARDAVARARDAATGKVARRLSEALEALQAATGTEGGDDGREQEPGEAAAASPGTDLLERLVEAWGATRDPRLREPIARLGVEVARRRPALVAKSKGELEGVWLALAQAKECADVDRLLGTPWPGAWKTARERVRALAEFPPDPRIVKGVLRVVGQYPSLGSCPMHRAIAALVEQVGDPGCLADLDRARSSRPGHESAYGRARERCQAAQPGKADPALLAEAKAAGGETQGLDELWRWFWADPTDAQRRLVLADALQVAGDPRGEFITVQCLLAEGGGDAKVRRRAAQLLEAHVDTWTGPLPGIERGSRRFERGFLVTATTGAKREELERSVQANEWRTLETLCILPGGDWNALVQRMPCLSTLALWRAEAASKLVAGGPMPQVRAFCGGEWVPVAGNKALPNLAVLGGSWNFYRYESELPKLAGFLARLADGGVPAVVLKNMSMDLLAPTLAAWAKAGPPELRLVTGWAYGFDVEGWRIRVRRGRRRADVAWAGGAGWRVGSVETCLEGLASAGLQEIAINPGRAEVGLEALAAAFDKRGVKLTASDDPIDLAAPPRPTA